MSPTSISGWIRSPARSSRSRARRRATTRRARSAAQRPGVARQLNDAISRLDARLSQISTPQPARQSPSAPGQAAARPTMVERAAAQVYRPSPPLSPASLDFAIAEITARQNELDASAPGRCRRASAPPHRACRRRPAHADGAAAAARRARIFPRSSGICSRSPARSRRCSAPTASSNRSPRSAANSPKSARHHRSDAAPGDRIDRERDPLAVAPHRREPPERRRRPGAGRHRTRARPKSAKSLRSLTPAEQLAGYDEAIRNLGAKLDLILRANDDPGTVQQLEGAIAALRAIVSNVASNDALARLSDDVRLCRPRSTSSRSAERQQRFLRGARTAHRRADLDAGKPRAAGGRATTPNSSKTRCAALSDRIDRMPVGNDSASAFAHLEQRVSLSAGAAGSLQRSPRAAISAASRTGCRTSCAISKRQQATFAALAENSRSAARSPPHGHRPDRRRQARIVRHPLQPVRDRPPHPGFAGGRSQHARPCRRPSRHDRRRSAHRSRPRRCAGRGAAADPGASRSSRRAVDARASLPPELPRPGRSRQPELPNPAAAQAAFRGRAARLPCRATPPAAVAADAADGDQRNPGAACRAAARRRSNPICRRTIRSSRARGRAAALPRRRSASRLPKTRSAKFRPPSASPVSTSSFIAAARRAAQAAAAAAGQRQSRRASRREAAGQGRPKAQAHGEQGTVDDHLQDPLAAGRRQRGRDRARHLQVGDDAARQRQRAAARPRSKARASRRAPGATARRAAASRRAGRQRMPSMTSPTPIGRQSLQQLDADRRRTTVAMLAIPQADRRRRPHRRSASDITGTIPTAPRQRPEARAWCRCRRPRDCRTRSADRRCAPPR